MQQARLIRIGVISPGIFVLHNAPDCKTRDREKKPSQGLVFQAYKKFLTDLCTVLTLIAVPVPYVIFSDSCQSAETERQYPTDWDRRFPRLLDNAVN